MPRYRKLPLVVEAERVPVYQEGGDITWYLNESIRIGEWCGGITHMMLQDDEHGGPRIEIQTLEGVMWVRPGDYIVKGVHGEFYPCKGDLFVKTYEVVESDDVPDR